MIKCNNNYNVYLYVLGLDCIEEMEVDNTCSVKVDNPSYKQTCSDTVETIVGTEDKYYFK